MTADSQKISSAKLWLCCGVSFAGALLFSGYKLMWPVWYALEVLWLIGEHRILLKP